MKNKIVGAVILAIIAVSLAFVGYTAFDKAAPKPRDIAAEFQDLANQTLSKNGVGAQFVQTQCDMTPDGYGCLTIIQNVETQELACGGVAFALLPDGSLPPVEEIYFEALTPDYCGL